MAMTVAIVEDDSLLRSSLASALERHGIRVTGAFGSAADVAIHVLEARPDAALLDLDLGPGPTWYRCVPTGGTNGRGEPNVRFDKDPGLTLLDAG